LSDPYCLIAFTNAIDQEGLIMNCPICEQEFYGTGYLTHNRKTLCVMCTKNIIDEHHYKFIGQYVKAVAK
jgi:hypothetical protein